MAIFPFTKIPPLQPPAEAAAWGFTKLAFYDDFTTADTIDLSNTKVNGFNWYRTPFFTIFSNPTPLSSDFVQSGSTLTITGSTNSNNYRPRLMTVADLGNHNYVGQTFPTGDGFYFEASMAFDPADTTQNTSNGWPSIWLDDLQLLQDSTPTYVNYTGSELDIFEAYPSAGAGAITPIWGLHNWQVDTNGTSVNVFDPAGQSTSYAAMGNPTFTNQNKYGTLVVIKAINGGNGFLKRIFNRNTISGLTHTWSGTSDYDYIESANYVILIEGGPSWAASFGYVAMWVRP